ncbi:MAG: dockerin type I repeat-containing protein [Acutalibacteraceae bacterium]
MPLCLTALNGEEQSSQAIWQYQDSPESFQWYFEPVGYQRGDVDMNGTISTEDVLLVQRYIAKVVSLDAAKKFLADMNNDGQINSHDVLKIQTLLSNG